MRSRFTGVILHTWPFTCQTVPRVALLFGRGLRPLTGSRGVLNALHIGGTLRIRNDSRHILLTAFLVIAAQSCLQDHSHAQAQPVSIFVVRHAETDTSQPTLPLTTVGRQRAELLFQTLRGVKFTHIFASHTTRARQMVEGIASAQGLAVIQLPVPGSILDGGSVTEQTSRRVATVRAGKRAELLSVLITARLTSRGGFEAVTILTDPSFDRLKRLTISDLQNSVNRHKST